MDFIGRSNYRNCTCIHSVSHLFFCSLFHCIYLPYQLFLKYLLYKYTFQNTAMINDETPGILPAYIIIQLISILYNSNNN